MTLVKDNATGQYVFASSFYPVWVLKRKWGVGFTVETIDSDKCAG